MKKEFAKIKAGMERVGIDTSGLLPFADLLNQYKNVNDTPIDVATLPLVAAYLQLTLDSKFQKLVGFNREHKRFLSRLSVSQTAISKSEPHVAIIDLAARAGTVDFAFDLTISDRPGDYYPMDKETTHFFQISTTLLDLSSCDLSKRVIEKRLETLRQALGDDYSIYLDDQPPVAGVVFLSVLGYPSTPTLGSLMENILNFLAIMPDVAPVFSELFDDAEPKSFCFKPVG